jgi:transcriptional regulator with XRE-family HTH domain
MPRTSAAILEQRAAAARSIGRRLAAGRERSGFTQLAAARALGVPQSRIAKLESGARSLQFIEGLRLATLYSMAPEDLDPDIE